MSLLAAYVVPHPPIIVKEIGQGEERKISKTVAAYKKVAEEIQVLKPDTIIISTPHNVMYQDYFHISPGSAAQGSFASFHHPELTYQVTYDQTLRDRIIQKATQNELAVGILGEKDARLDHGVMVPLSFLKEKQTMIRLSLSGEDFISHYRYGKAIQEAINESDKKVVYIASGDLSHVLKKDGPYGFAKEGPKFDQQITDILKKGTFDQLLSIDETFSNQAKECGLRSFIMMAGVLDKLELEKEFLSYEGPFGVGYAIAKYLVKGQNQSLDYLALYQAKALKEIESKRAKESPHVQLARASLEYYLVHHQYLKTPKTTPKELLDEQKAVFVTIKKHGRLRGCIGTLEPTKKMVALEIIHNAVSAGLRDPRFPEVTIDELKDLTYSVDVLSSPEDIEDVSELDPKLYGVIVYTNRKSGLLLPNLEGIDTVEEQLRIAKQKANIREDENFFMKRFKVVRHH